MEENSSSILVVDDNPEIREIIQVLLGGEGYLVETAGNGVKALEMLENREYDLIILDIMMPGMDGYQTCRKVIVKAVLGGGGKEWMDTRRAGRCGKRVMHRFYF